MKRRNADRYYRDEQGDPPAPRKRLDWTNVAAGLLVGVGGILFGRVLSKSDTLNEVQTKAQIIPDRRDRELDQNFAWRDRQVSSLERRIEALERSCRE